MKYYEICYVGLIIHPPRITENCEKEGKPYCINLIAT